NHDGCMEWGPIVPCAEGTTCSAGQCSGICKNDCIANECNGLVFQSCGQYDLDSCKDLSPGKSCVPSDPCLQGKCTPTGCQSAPKLCQSAPPSICRDAYTITVYDAVGSCSNGTCTYASHDVACANCPSCDPCQGITCNTPPNSCFAATGTCANGRCTYAYS